MKRLLLLAGVLLLASCTNANEPLRTEPCKGSPLLTAAGDTVGMIYVKTFYCAVPKETGK